MRLTLLVLLTIAISGEMPAAAAPAVPNSINLPPSVVVPVARCCVCIGGSVSGGGAHCTEWECSECKVSAPMTPIRNRFECLRSRRLVCDGNSCKETCKARLKLGKQ